MDVGGHLLVKIIPQIKNTQQFYIDTYTKYAIMQHMNNIVSWVKKNYTASIIIAVLIIIIIVF